MTIAIPFDPNRSENEHRTNANGDGCQPCIVCGRKVRDPKYVVHVHGGGVIIVTEAEAAQMDESADLGMYPIGPDCLNAHPEIKPYVQEEPRRKPLNWKALYHDLYRQTHGEQASINEISADAQKRAAILAGR